MGKKSHEFRKSIYHHQQSNVPAFRTRERAKKINKQPMHQFSERACRMQPYVHILCRFGSLAQLATPHIIKYLFSHFGPVKSTRYFPKRFKGTHVPHRYGVPMFYNIGGDV
jgi:hypothetical protein